MRLEDKFGKRTKDLTKTVNVYKLKTKVSESKNRLTTLSDKCRQHVTLYVAVDNSCEENLVGHGEIVNCKMLTFTVSKLNMYLQFKLNV